MPTVSYKDSLQAIAEQDPTFAEDMLADAVTAMLSGNLNEGRILLKDYVRSTLGFAELGRRMGKDEKNIMRSLSPRGNPTASNLMAIVQACAQAGGVHLTARVEPRQQTPAPA